MGFIALPFLTVPYGRILSFSCLMSCLYLVSAVLSDGLLMNELFLPLTFSVNIKHFNFTLTVLVIIRYMFIVHNRRAQMNY